MIQLITGGSGSGKSAYAEAQILSFEGTKRIYIATMYSYDEESHKRIARHQAMRKDKGFHTIECYTGLEQVEIPQGADVLLECMSNLVANEMFRTAEMPDEMHRERIVTNIVKGIRRLSLQADHLLIVTNEICSDGVMYGTETIQYQKCLGEINCRLAQMADQVTEVVYGIPITQKSRQGQIKD